MQRKNQREAWENNHNIHELRDHICNISFPLSIQSSKGNVTIKAYALYYGSTNVSLHDEISMHDNGSTSIKIAPAALGIKRSWRLAAAAVDRLSRCLAR